MVQRRSWKRFRHRVGAGGGGLDFKQSLGLWFFLDDHGRICLSLAGEESVCVEDTILQQIVDNIPTLRMEISYHCSVLRLY